MTTCVDRNNQRHVPARSDMWNPISIFADNQSSCLKAW